MKQLTSQWHKIVFTAPVYTLLNVDSHVVVHQCTSSRLQYVSRQIDGVYVQNLWSEPQNYDSCVVLWNSGQIHEKGRKTEYCFTKLGYGFCIKGYTSSEKNLNNI